MFGRAGSILLCAMTAFCPALCAAELAGHADDHAHPLLADNAHSHPQNHVPHHEHDSNGDPVPYAQHTCICSGNSLTSPVVQIPQMLPLAIAAPDVDLRPAALARFVAGPARSALTDPGGAPRNLPLLI